MQFNPAWFVKDNPQEVSDAAMIVVGQEYMDAHPGTTVDQANTALGNALQQIEDSGATGQAGAPTAENVSAILNVAAPAQADIDAAQAIIIINGQGAQPVSTPSSNLPQQSDQEAQQIDHLTQFATNVILFLEQVPANGEQAGYLQAAKDHAAAMSPGAAAQLLAAGVTNVAVDPTSEAGIQQAMQQACQATDVPYDVLAFVRQNESGNATGAYQQTVTNSSGYGGFFGLPQSMLGGSVLDQCVNACNVLNAQHATFGNWKEAICAYNVGPRGDFSQSYCQNYTGPQ